MRGVFPGFPVPAECVHGAANRGAHSDEPNRMIARKKFHPSGNRKGGFTLIEVLFALAILTFGLLSLLTILQRALQATEPVEFETRAALLAQSILDGIRSDPTNFPFVPGLNPGTWPVIQSSSAIYPNDFSLLKEDGSSYQLPYAPFVFSIPGDGVDNDSQIDVAYRWRDGNSNGIDDLMESRLSDPQLGPLGPTSKRDFDGGIEPEVSRFLFSSNPNFSFNGLDDDQDGLRDDFGDYFIPTINIPVAYGLPGGVKTPYGPDGDFSYDPQRGIDEELPDGKDNDGDSLIDEDLSLATQLQLRSPGVLLFGNSDANPYNYQPLFVGNGLDDDGDSTDYSDTNNNDAPDKGESGVDFTTGLVMMDGLDNNLDGRIDEGIDEEIYDKEDNDNAPSVSVDEDCRAALMPFNPLPFPPPNDLYSFQIAVRRVPVVGNGTDSDRDGMADGDLRDNDGDAEIRTALGLADRGIDEEVFDGVDNDGDGLTDEDVRAYPAANTILVTVRIYRGDDRIDNDNDGWIDEEPADGWDNDWDGEIDEDTYQRVYNLTGLVRLPE